MESDYLLNWRDNLIYTAQGAQPQVLAENERLRVISAGLEPGAQIPEHPEAMGVYLFLEGSGQMFINGEQFPVQAGTALLVPENASRGVIAETRLAFLAIRVT